MLIAKRGFVILVFVTATFLAFTSASRSCDHYFLEDFENGFLGWSAGSKGVWQAGLPTVGPQDCNAGNNPNSKKCATTGLNGNYDTDKDSILISPFMVLPAVSGNKEIHLRFWTWFSYSTGDSGQVQVSVQDSVTKIWGHGERWDTGGCGVTVVSEGCGSDCLCGEKDKTRLLSHCQLYRSMVSRYKHRMVHDEY